MTSPQVDVDAASRGELARSNGGDPERTTTELIGDLAGELGTLVRQEVRLASTEMSRKVSRAMRQAVYVVVGLLIGVVSVLMLVQSVVFGLAVVLPLWGSSLIVGLVGAVIAGLIVAKGVASLERMSLMPRKTVQSLQEDKQWLQDQIR